eukprot:scaffold600_cov279-Pinguiococcus_pyrenoidosus.AAC.6
MRPASKSHPNAMMTSQSQNTGRNAAKGRWNAQGPPDRLVFGSASSTNIDVEPLSTFFSCDSQLTNPGLPRAKRSKQDAPGPM